MPCLVENGREKLFLPLNTKETAHFCHFLFADCHFRFGNLVPVKDKRLCWGFLRIYRVIKT